MERRVRSLLTELHRPATGNLNTQLGCALEKKPNCCDGIGYRLRTQGALIQADICGCVQNCESCFGKNRVVVDGKSRPCRTPAPSRIAGLINAAALPARYCNARFGAFTNHTGNNKEQVERLTKWTREFDPENPRGLMLGGPVGVGKTYLLVAIAKTFANRGISVRFIDFFQLLLELKAGYAQDKNDARLLNEAIDVDVLFIDELGKGKGSDWELSVLDQLVMGRYNQNKIIITSTNYKIKSSDRVRMPQALDEKKPGSFELDRMESLEERIGSRVYSRLIETSDTFELTGDDFRRRGLK